MATLAHIWEAKLLKFLIQISISCLLCAAFLWIETHHPGWRTFALGGLTMGTAMFWTEAVAWRK